MPKVYEVLCRAAMVRTLCQLPEIEYVGFRVDGKPLTDLDEKPIGLMNEDQFIENAGEEINAYKTADLTLYYANQTGDKLVTQRVAMEYNTNISLERLIVEQLIAGPPFEGVYPTIPSTTKVVSTAVRDGICYVNLDSGFLETALSRREEIETAVDGLLAGIAADASEYEKVKYVYDTLIRNTDYDLGAPDNQNIYSVFVRHFSVCQGYAKATQYLLNRLGVESTLVLGTVETGEGHAWNLVKVDGEYYYLDTTWGDVSYRTEDTASQPEASLEEGLRISMPEINYDYLNVTTEELLRTHSIGGEVPMPLCTATAANYYVMEGALFTVYDRAQMEALFQKAVESGQSDITIKCADAACYEEVLTELIEEQEIFDYLSDEESSIAYAQNEKQHSLTFWVTNE